MKKHTILALTAIVALLAVTMLAGCVEEEAPTPAYKIFSEEDVSFGNTIRVAERVLVPRTITEEGVKAIAKDIVQKGIASQDVNAIGIFFYYKPEASPEYCIGRVDWAPYGVWSKAMEVPTGDYSKQEYYYDFFTKLPLPPLTSMPAPTITSLSPAEKMKMALQQNISYRNSAISLSSLEITPEHTVVLSMLGHTRDIFDAKEYGSAVEMIWFLVEQYNITAVTVSYRENERSDVALTITAPRDIVEDINREYLTTEEIIENFDVSYNPSHFKAEIERIIGRTHYPLVNVTENTRNYKIVTAKFRPRAEGYETFYGKGPSVVLYAMADVGDLVKHIFLLDESIKEVKVVAQEVTIDERGHLSRKDIMWVELSRTEFIRHENTYGGTSYLSMHQDEKIFFDPLISSWVDLELPVLPESWRKLTPKEKG